jgi:hypothetical protein
MGAGYSAHRDFTEAKCPPALVRLQAFGMLTLEPERLQNQLATTSQRSPEMERGSSPETLKRLAISVSQRRSFLSRNSPLYAAGASAAGASMIWSPRLAAFHLR